MSNVRDLGQKIRSLENMQKVTRAMNMISSIKLRKHLSQLSQLTAFCEAVEEIRRAIVPSLADSAHPLVRGYERVESEHLVVFTADKGLCGVHNSSVLKEADAFASEARAAGRSVSFSCFGIKGHNHGQRESWQMHAFHPMNERSLERDQLKQVADDVFERFIAGQIQRVCIVGKIYVNSLEQNTVLKQILPLEMPGEDGESAGASGPGLTMEPSGDQMALEYARVFLADTLRAGARHSFLSEHSARLTAMENATSNSEDMISKYKNMQNHARQATITNELIEIVSGKEALKG